MAKTTDAVVVARPSKWDSVAEFDRGAAAGEDTISEILARRVRTSLVDREELPLMVKVGDRIRLSSMKGPQREGVVTAVTGTLMRVRWSSDEETTVAPAPGTLTVLAAGKASPSKAAKRKSAAKGTAGAKKKSASKRAAPKKN